MKYLVCCAALIAIASGCTPEQESAAPEVVPVEEEGNVRILRDEYGVPHVFADSVDAAYFGYGYAVAEDRLFQMEMTRRSAYGQVAEVLGEEYIDFDVSTRKLYDFESIQDQIDSLPQEYRGILEAYAAGFNQRLDEVLASPESLLPKEFHDYGFEPGHWDARDVSMLFVGTLVNRFADYNTELENAAILAAIEGVHGAETAPAIFDALNPRYRDNAPTTIKPVEGPNYAQTGTVVNSSSQMGIEIAARYAREPSFFTRIGGASNFISLGRSRTEGANALLLNGPQFGWFAPSYVYSIGLHAPGFDLVGNTPFGNPIILLGHNGHIGWGSTWGAGDLVDLYQLSLNPDDPMQYRYKDEWHTFNQRPETVKVKGGGSIEITALDSVHGIISVHDPETGVAYAKKRSWEGKELQSLFTWFESMRAQDPEAWLARAADHALNINWYYTDRDGNIGYAFTGHYPVRAEGHDNRLPANGDGSMDWLGIQPFSQSPQIVNPHNGVIANWNNKPAPGVMNPDMFWYSWSRADRVEVLDELLAGQDRWTSDSLWDLLEPSSYADPNARYFIPLIASALERTENGSLQQALAHLEQWDGVSRDSDLDGYFDTTATVIFRRFLTLLLSEVLSDDLGESFAYFANTGHATADEPTGGGTNVQTGTKTVLDALNGDLESFDFLNGESADTVVAQVMEETISDLINERGDDMDTWRDGIPPRPYSHLNFLGIPQTTEEGAMVGRIEQNRGTENNLFIFNDDGIVGYEVTPPGQSGFLPPDGSPNPHHSDQMEMYINFERKRVWFTEAEVREHLQSEQYLTY